VRQGLVLSDLFERNSLRIWMLNLVVAREEGYCLQYLGVATSKDMMEEWSFPGGRQAADPAEVVVVNGIDDRDEVEA